MDDLHPATNCSDCILDVCGMHVYMQCLNPKLIHDFLEMYEVLCMGMCNILSASRALGTYWATRSEHPDRGLLEAVFDTYLCWLIVVVCQSYQNRDAQRARRVVWLLKLG